jgi:ATP-dependent helicase YprA (DUF1998 family)
LEQKILV